QWPHVYVYHQDAAGIRTTEARRGNRERFARAEPHQGREDHAQAGGRHRKDQAGRSEYNESRIRGPHRDGYGAQYGHRSRRIEARATEHGVQNEAQENAMGKAGGKNIEKARKLVEARAYKLGEAAELLKKAHFVKFDETVELSINLGVDPKQSDQMVRGTVVLPNGLGKSKRVLVIATGEKVKEAQDAGADFVGGEDMVVKIQGGWTDYDAVIATPDMMKSAGRLGKVLGPRGLMPNPKTGTVTFDIAKAVQEIKAGKVEFRLDKTGIIHSPVGKISFTAEKLAENALALLGAVSKAKPATAKGKYIRRVTLTSTMGPGILIDHAEVEAAAAA